MKSPRLLLTLLLVLHQPTGARGDEVSVSNAFKIKVAAINSEKLAFFERDLNSRVNYLENRQEIHRLYTEGLPASRDRRRITEAFENLINADRLVRQNIQNFSLNESCNAYFTAERAAFDSLFGNTKAILDQKDSLGSQSLSGYFWRKNKPNRTSIPRSVAQATIQFELTVQALNFHQYLFLSGRENSVGLLGVESPQCIQGKDREQLTEFVKVRSLHLSELSLLILGKRGVWDVQSLSNLIAGSAQEEMKKLKREIYISSGIMLAGFLILPYVTPYLATQFPLVASFVARPLIVMNYTYALYLGAKSGYGTYRALHEAGPEILAADANESAMKMLDLALNLPKSEIDLYRLVSEYETQLHLETLKLSPERNASGWLPKAIEVHGEIPRLIQVYKAQVDYIRQTLQSRSVH